MTFTLKTAHWPEDREALRQVRETVFVHEQGVPLTLEWDDQDATATHLVAVTADQHPIGTGRLLPNGHIGRMAVLAPLRGQGVGSALLNALVALARNQGLVRVTLNAQCTAIGFYARMGFKTEGAIFDDAGIPHQTMCLDLSHD